MKVWTQEERERAAKGLDARFEATEDLAENHNGFFYDPADLTLQCEVTAAASLLRRAAATHGSSLAEQTQFIHDCGEWLQRNEGAK